ncbi:phage tail protein [Dyella jejuensis]|uniref:Phage tail protein n=1 Tax=Dyella jejuensis TaxID=1432009 RepID=A0ABW8JGH2_9GAMM
MATFYLGQVMLTGFPFAQKGFAQCNGQLLPINQNQALFSLLGTQFGGDGIRTFALPDLRGRTPVGSTATGSTVGQVAGVENVTLLSANMPAHNHVAMGSTTAGDKSNPTGNLYGGSGSEPIYAASGSSVVLDPVTLANAGGNAPHPNMQPSLVINFNIALTGIFPSRN